MTCSRTLTLMSDPLARRSSQRRGAAWRPLLLLLILTGLTMMALTAHAEAGTSEGWFVILGSLPETEEGMRQANALADQVDWQFAFNHLIVSESVFYPGLTPGLYVVMLGPYSSSASARQALQQSGIKRLVSDAYVKKARIRAFD